MLRHNRFARALALALAASVLCAVGGRAPVSARQQSGAQQQPPRTQKPARPD
jgi:Ca-activated chloride channel homolog